MRMHTTPVALGALVLASGAFGVHLGESAIDQINPIHFQGPSVHPRDRGAAVPEFSYAPQAPQFAQLYGWEEGADARATDCGSCESLEARDRHAGGQVVFAVMETGWSDVSTQAAIYHPQLEAAPQEQAEEEPESYAAEAAEVERYAAFAVEAPAEETAEPVELAELQE